MAEFTKGTWFAYERDQANEISPVIYHDGISATEVERIIQKFPITLDEAEAANLGELQRQYPLPGTEAKMADGIDVSDHHNVIRDPGYRHESYVPPDQQTELQRAQLQAVGTTEAQLLQFIEQDLKSCRSANVAKTQLETAFMWLRRAIVRGE